MSLYTPVFPPTEVPPLEATPSSSLSSTSTGTKRPQGLSYTSRLSHWHLSIAALPEELYPASEPSSPTSQERSEKLQATIEEAVRGGRYIGDLCKLRSTKLGYASRQPAASHDGPDIPYVLADTEEEWLEWEKRVAEQRVNFKGKQRESLKFVPPKSKPLSSRDKVMGWKTGLVPSSKSAIEKTPSQPKETQQTKLGFAVVKRSSMLKTTKATKASIPVSSASDMNSNEVAPTPPQPPPISNDSEMGALDHQITADMVAAPDCPADDKHSPLSISGFASKSDLALQISEAEQGQLPRSLNVSTYLPSSFPSQLPTSTPKRNVVPALNLAQQDVLELRPHIYFATVSETAEGVNPLVQRISEVATPPSPPPSSQDSPVPNSRNVHHTASLDSGTAQPILFLAENKHVRPLTPPPEDGAPMTATSQTTPRTPEKQPLKKHRTMPASYKSSNGPSTPSFLINGGGSVVRRIPGVPTTPDQRAAIDLLATSRKSVPRPRPPSRKDRLREEQMNLEAASEAGDPSPAKSERSYFSSPASGDSSGSIMSAHLPSSPTSPLNFTQNPEKFAPLGQSTQASPLARHLRSPSNPRSATSRSQLDPSQPSSAGGGLHRASSGLMGMVYNSQFDLESRVNQVSNFLEKDVDFAAWVRDEDDDDDEARRVEELTSASLITSQ